MSVGTKSRSTLSLRRSSWPVRPKFHSSTALSTWATQQPRGIITAAESHTNLLNTNPVLLRALTTGPRTAWFRNTCASQTNRSHVPCACACMWAPQKQASLPADLGAKVGGASAGERPLQVLIPVVLEGAVEGCPPAPHARRPGAIKRRHWAACPLHLSMQPVLVSSRSIM